MVFKCMIMMTIMMGILVIMFMMVVIIMVLEIMIVTMMQMIMVIKMVMMKRRMVSSDYDGHGDDDSDDIGCLKIIDGEISIRTILRAIILGMHS